MDPNRLKAITLFQTMSDDDLRALATLAGETSVPEGQELVREGDFSYQFFAIEEGTASVERDGARARAGGAPGPDLTIRLGVADFLRVAAGELDPAKALLSGRLDLEGDFTVAMRLAAMFGQGSPL